MRAVLLRQLARHPTPAVRLPPVRPGLAAYRSQEPVTYFRTVSERRAAAALLRMVQVRRFRFRSVAPAAQALLSAWTMTGFRWSSVHLVRAVSAALGPANRCRHRHPDHRLRRVRVCWWLAGLRRSSGWLAQRTSRCLPWNQTIGSWTMYQWWLVLLLGGTGLLTWSKRRKIDNRQFLSLIPPKLSAFALLHFIKMPQHLHRVTIIVNIYLRSRQPRMLQLTVSFSVNFKTLNCWRIVSCTKVLTSFMDIP